MNYLTALIATPLFFLIWLFELRLFWTSTPRILKQGKDIVALAYVVSTLEMISCWFWLFGFALGKTDNVFSEALGSDEHGNCAGLVGAEVILATFQFLTALYSMLQMFVIRFVYSSSTKWKVHKMKRTRGENTFLAAFVFLGLAYLPICWITAWNRRCPQGERFGTEFQHIFYPTFVVVDGFTSSLSLYFARDVARRVNAKAIKSTVERGPKARSSESIVVELTRYFTFQCRLTLFGVIVAVSSFIMQYTMRFKELALVACVFCTILYTTYAVRRVPMLMKYLRSDHAWAPRSWAVLWNTRYSPPGAIYLTSTDGASSTHQKPTSTSSNHISTAAVAPIGKNVDAGITTLLYMHRPF